MINARNLRWFLIAPITTAVIIVLIGAAGLALYQQQHAGRVFTGVSVWGVDLSGMNEEDAGKALLNAFDYPSESSIVLTDPQSGREWIRPPAALGVRFDVQSTVDLALAVGREGDPLSRLGQQFGSWYYGHQVSPIVIFDESVLDQAIAEIAEEIDRPAQDASLAFDGSNVSFASAQVGLSLDKSDARARLQEPLSSLQNAQVQLLVHETHPRVQDTGEAAEQIKSIISGPMSLYLREPLEDVDLDRVELTVEELANWIRINVVDDEAGNASTEVIVDENAFRAWLTPYAAQLQRKPVNARFYFDDNTRELVLVEPHVSGRELDIEATTRQFLQQVNTANRSLPFALREIVPEVNSQATASDLNITELISESTTWFHGSSAERKHNIARAASNFYGIVVAPGEEFSFNEYLGDVTAEMGYQTGLIIFGGRTIEGVGGGVCQVSTTAFQAAFWAGYPIVERWEHGYRVGYYDDGEGPGMDATVYSPIVDFRFINDTPYNLLIENYYSEANSSLTFKFYSTGLGRIVNKDGPYIENVVPPKPDIWEYSDEVESGEIVQIDWAVEGSDVTVGREVLNNSGDLIRQDTFVSHYIPWQNIYQYGDGAPVPGSAQPSEATTQS
jgi:vancomycin resistance protein YoaR